MGIRKSRRSASADPPLSPHGPRDEEILKAALDVFSDRGFHGATMLDVARRARASKTTLYNRFENKVGLFQALLAWENQQGLEDLKTIASDLDVDPLTSLYRYASRLLANMLKPDKLALFRIAAAEGARLPDVGRAFSALTRERGIIAGRVLILRLVESGLIQIEDADEFAHCFIGLLRGDLFNRVLVGVAPPPGQKEIEQHARRAMNRLVRAFAP
jgi:TetR/AcrR family transcriptional repressor of mexJK operon